MSLTFATLWQLIVLTLRNPREGAEAVLSLGIPREALWPLMGLVVIVSVMLAQVSTFLLGGTVGPLAGSLFVNPLFTAAMQYVLLAIAAFAIHFIGRAMGGTGSLAEAVLLTTWLQVIMAAVQVVQTLTFVILPPLGGLIGILALVAFFWLLTHFVAVIHGFQSLAQVFLMILVSMIGIAFVLSLVLTMAGLMVPGAP